MISKLSCIITDLLLTEDIIEDTDREIYSYGTELIISSMINIVLVVTVGLLSNQIIECLIFYFVFCFMRLFCGGYHSDSYFKCSVLFVGILLLVLFFNKLLIEAPTYYWIVMTIYSTVILSFLSPIENPNKPLDLSEKKKNKRKSLTEMVIWLAVAAIMCLANSKLNHIIILTLFSVSTLILSALIAERREYYDEVS